MDEQTSILHYLNAVKQQAPLVVNITNYVAMNNSANALLALGASPIMAHSREELGEMVALCGALVINIGTLDSVWCERMRFAVQQANHYQKPVVLDPVGCGATSLRTAFSRELAQLAEYLIIRANASETMALAGVEAASKGVDSAECSDSALTAATLLVKRYGANVVVSGETDYVVSEQQIIALNNGSAMMPRVTAMGCSLSAVTGAFAAVGDMSGLGATAVFGVAGELAAQQAQGPGSLQVALLDCLYNLNSEQLLTRLRVRDVQYELNE